MLITCIFSRKSRIIIIHSRFILGLKFIITKKYTNLLYYIVDIKMQKDLLNLHQYVKLKN